jgi:zinc transport system permease protein
MIEDFFAVWPLFENAFLAGWGIALVLSILGIVVVARDQIFIGVAMSQASMLGIALGMLAGASAVGTAVEVVGSEAASAAWAVAFSVGCVLLTARAAGRGAETYEAITGWVFLAAGSLSILLLAHSPHGTEEIHRLVASTLLGAQERDVALFAVLSALIVGAAVFLRRPIMLAALDPPMAASVGLPLRFMNTVLAVVLGVAVGLSIRVSGMLYTCGCLVLPAMAAKSFCREVSQMFWVAPVVGVSTAVAAFILANEYDYPPGQMTVALLSGVVVVARMGRETQRLVTASSKE